MRLIVTEKNNSAKKIAEILSGGTGEGGRLVQDAVSTRGLTTTASHMTIGLKGHVLNPAFPEVYNNWQKTNPRDLIDADADQGADRQERRPGAEEGRQGRRRPRDRDRLRPRGRADRPRGAAGDRRGQPRAGDRRGRARATAPGQARPLLGADQGRDRARLRRTSTSSPIRSPTPAPRARTWT